MPAWQLRLFMALATNAAGAGSFYSMPSNRVTELGQQITL